MIVISLVTGLMTSLIPNLTSNLVENDSKGVEDRINKTYQFVLFFVIPMTVGLSILAEPVWTIFYGASKFGPSAYSFLVFVALATSLFTTTTMIVQILKGNKVLFISLFAGILSKILLNIPFMYLSELLQKPILSLYEGEILGNIHKIYFNKTKNKISSFEVLDDEDLSYCLQPKFIYTIGKHATTIKNKQNLILSLDFVVRTFLCGFFLQQISKH